MTLIAIILATLASGIGSVWLAAFLLRRRRSGSDSVGPQHLLSLAAGALLATAFMHLLPEAFESQASAQELFATLLVGVVFFFLLEKAELWHHGHEHGDAHAHSHAHSHGHNEGHGHDHGHANPAGGARLGGWTVLTGDSVHCFGDGVLIASAFVADMRLGWIAAASVLAHEVPHHMGDLVIMLNKSTNRNMALVKVSLAGAVTALGGLAGYFLLEQLHDWLPYFLVVASSSFVYVALADLIPQLQRRLSVRETVMQIAMLLTGMGVVTLVSGLAHGGH